MWRSTSTSGKWLAGGITAIAVTLTPWWVSVVLVVIFSLWFTDWYQVLLPALWFDILYGSPVALSFYPGKLPVTVLIILFIMVATQAKRYIRFQP